jgi:hypothetical protein
MQAMRRVRELSRNSRPSASQARSLMLSKASSSSPCARRREQDVGVARHRIDAADAHGVVAGEAPRRLERRLSQALETAGRRLLRLDDAGVHLSAHHTPPSGHPRLDGTRAGEIDSLTAPAPLGEFPTGGGSASELLGEPPWQARLPGLRARTSGWPLEHEQAPMPALRGRSAGTAARRSRRSTEQHHHQAHHLGSGALGLGLRLPPRRLALDLLDVLERACQ